MKVIEKELKEIIDSFDVETTDCWQLMCQLMENQFDGSKKKDALNSIVNYAQVIQDKLELFVDKYTFKEHNEKYFEEVTNE